MELPGTRRGYASAALDAFAVKLGINGSTLEDTEYTRYRYVWPEKSAPIA